MKFNWGTGILLFFIFFAVSMTAAVIATTKYPPQLVQKDYYALDLKYQERLDKKQHAAALPVKPAVQFAAAENAIHITFPEGMNVKGGTVNCYRSMTTRDDVKLNLEPGNSLSIDASQLARGRWHVELDWESSSGEQYFWETAINL